MCVVGEPVLCYPHTHSKTFQHTLSSCALFLTTEAEALHRNSASANNLLRPLAVCFCTHSSFSLFMLLFFLQIRLVSFISLALSPLFGKEILWFSNHLNVSGLCNIWEQNLLLLVLFFLLYVYFCVFSCEICALKPPGLL